MYICNSYQFLWSTIIIVLHLGHRLAGRRLALPPLRGGQGLLDECKHACVYTYIYIYIYIYRERERDPYIYIYICIYTYVFMYTCIEREEETY